MLETFHLHLNASIYFENIFYQKREKKVQGQVQNIRN